MATKRQFAVIGLGRFGHSVAETLVKKGCEVLAIDRDETKIQAISDLATFAVQCDATDERALKAVSCQNVDVAVVSIGENIEASVLVAEDVFGKRYQLELEPTDDIAELCARLDSLPLAVELAAARTKALSPARILERLAQRLDLLQGGRDAEARQQTLRATIEWSYDLLTPEEQQLFARLSVFAGGCTLEAAEDVCGADLDTLQSLLEKSLLRFSSERYWMLETIREYAGERFGESHEADELEKRHVEWFAVFAEQASSHLKEGDPRPWLERLGRERENLRAALESCARLGLSVSRIRLAGALGPFWFLRGELVEGRRWLGEALADETADSRLRVRALPSAIMIDLFRGSVDVADELAQELFALSGCLDAGARAEALHLRGAVASFRRDFIQAAALFEKSAELSREAGYSWLLPQTINNLGDCAMNLGDAVRAESYLQEALTVAYASGNADPATMGVALSNLGMLAVDRGDVEQARLARRIGRRAGGDADRPRGDQAGAPDRAAQAPRGRHGRADRRRHRLAAPYDPGRHLRRPQEEARPHRQATGAKCPRLQRVRHLLLRMSDGCQAGHARQLPASRASCRRVTWRIADTQSWT